MVSRAKGDTHIYATGRRQHDAKILFWVVFRCIPRDKASAKWKIFVLYLYMHDARLYVSRYSLPRHSRMRSGMQTITQIIIKPAHESCIKVVDGCCMNMKKKIILYGTFEGMCHHGKLQQVHKRSKKKNK